MPRTTSSSSLSSPTARLLLAGCVAATALAGAGQASAADEGDPWALTGAGPAYLSTNSPAKVTLTGKGFTSASVVTFTNCLADPAASAAATGATPDAKGRKLTVTPPACLAGRKPRIKVVTDGDADSTRILYTSKITYVQEPVVTAVAPVSPAVGPWTGGAAATVTLQSAPVEKAVVQVRLGAGRPVVAKVRKDDPRTFSFTTPPGVPGAAPVSVSVFGIASAEVAAAYTYESTVKVSPSSWVTSAPAPLVKVSGAGFGTDRSKVTLSVCGAALDPSAVKSITDKAISFVPAVPATSVLPGGVGACTVTVAVTGGATSVVTAGSTFTFARY